MFNLPGYDTSGFKSIPQLSPCTPLLFYHDSTALIAVTGMTKHVVLNLSPLRTSLDSRELCQTPASRAGHNAALPVNQIPAELLGDIFIKFLEDDREFPDYAPATRPLVSLHTRADPMILGQVCSWWRDVTLSTAALWANIFILEPKISQIFRTRLWLDRAGNNLLNIAIRDTRESGYGLASFHEILLLLASRRQFWRKVNLVLPDVALEALVAIITKQPIDFRNLESATLSIICQQPSHKGSVDAIWKAFHSSPVLHEVDWRGAFYNELPAHAPWAQLTHLNLLSEFSASSLSDILISCPRIQVLFIFRLSLSSEASQPEPILLKNLHTLTLEAAVETGPLFGRLTLPSLRLLDIRHRYLDEDLSSDFFPFQEFLVRSNCCLERFALYDENLEEDHLYGYISSPHLRNVTFLDLQVPISDKIITSFTRQTNGGFHEIMPFLEGMRLLISSSCDGLLAQMASSRWADLNADKSHKLLKFLILDKDGDYGIEDELGLSKLFNAGLQGLKS